MNKTLYPENTAVAVKVEKLIKITDKRLLSERMSSKMIRCAAVLKKGGHIGWQMIVPTKGLTRVSVFGTNELSRSDLEWITEKTGKTSKCMENKGIDSVLTELYEIYLPVVKSSLRAPSIGFGSADIANATNAKGDGGFLKWPVYFSSHFDELLRVLMKTGAALRAVAGPATEEEQSQCRKDFLRTNDVQNIPFKEYLGRPTKVRVLLRLPEVPSVRLRTVIEESVHGAIIKRVGTMEDPECVKMWDRPLDNALILPDYAARVLMMEPEVREEIVGIEVCEEEVKKIPASHKNVKDKKAVVIGHSIDTAGIRRTITIGETDLKRHYQIIGQTGTGKSTLLATLILSAIKCGHGLTFFDPHGSTIDTVLRSLPEKYSDRVRVVRIGDAENPVPMNIWDSDDPSKEERTINDLCDLFGDIFDPKKEGILGPRWERWFATFAKASIAFLGRRASLESITVISQSQDNMLKLCKAIFKEYPGLVETIKQEYGLDRSSDFQGMLNWYLSKFQRLTSVEQLRKTLGAGGNALDFDHTIDTPAVTLIDLASPVLGTHASRIIGTILLMKLWNAAMGRQNRELTHIVGVDEAALFQTNPMPRMLAEARKFGISMVLCHQHAGQLTREIREALEANSANFSAFRLSPRDAETAAVRFDDPEMRFSLARLDAFNAITTLSVDGKQTSPFTLETIRPTRQKNEEELAGMIEERSKYELVEPYRDLRALTAEEIHGILNDPDKLRYLRYRKPASKIVKDFITASNSTKVRNLDYWEEDEYVDVPS